MGRRGQKGRDSRHAAVTKGTLEVEVDPSSGVPVITSVLHDIDVLLRANGYLGLVLIDISPLAWIEFEYGSAIYNQTISELAKDVVKIQREILRSGDLLCSARPHGEHLLLFLEGPRGQSYFKGQELAAVVDRIFLALTPTVGALTSRFGRTASLHLGYALVLPNPMVQPERLVYRAIDEAALMALDHSRRVAAQARERLRDLLVRKQLRIVFQPLVRLKDLQIMGYEALVRGPKDTELAAPSMIFALAKQANRVGELAQACFELSVAEIKSLPPGTLLFANVWPTLINDGAFRTRLLDTTRGVEPSRLVLELFEGATVHNHAILAHGLDELREHGFGIAIDDLGVGNANLDHILRLQPNFLKLDISLIEDIDESIAKQAVVSSVVSIAKATGATVVAEGVETELQHRVLLELDVAWAQGFFFARPAPGFLEQIVSPPPQR